MLREANVMAVVAAQDLSTARDFYEQTLGLGEPLQDDTHTVVYQCGNSQLQLYQSTFAGTNQATCASWEVGDLATTTQELVSRGVAFEHYDMPGMTLEGDMHVSEDGQKVAWFKDPDGNILCLHEPAD